MKMKNKNIGTNQKKQAWKNWANTALSVLFALGILSSGFGGYTFARSLNEKPSDSETNIPGEESSREPNNEAERFIASDNYAYQFDPGNISHDEESGISYINNVVLIFFNDGVSEKTKKDIVNSINGAVIGEFKTINQCQVQISRKNFGELKQICADLVSLPEIMHATYDMALQIRTNAIVIPDDPWDNDNWDENNPSGNNWWLEAIQAPSAWSYNSRLGSIKIGIVDNGFDTGHEDLKGVLSFPDSAYEKVNSKENHGTHVAGIIGAKANNKKGITGIIWDTELICFDWQPTWLQSKFTDWNTATFIAAGLIATVTSGAKAVNFSLGCSANLANDSSTFSREWINEFGNQASLYMASLLKKGYDFVVIQSAGNGASNGIGVDAIYNGWFSSVTSDNCYNGLNNVSDILNRIIIVGAAQQNGFGYIQANFSNGGGQVDICAPGFEVYSTITGGFSGKYGNMSGTSMAAPIVAGVCGLVWAANKDLSGDQVKNIVCNNSNITVGENAESPNTTGTYRMVNAYLAVSKALSTPVSNPKNPVTTKPYPDKFDSVVTLVCDVSGSMNDRTETGETKIEALKEAGTVITGMVDVWSQRYLGIYGIGVVQFASNAKSLTFPHIDYPFVTQCIRSMGDGGGTNISSGLEIGIEQLNNISAKSKVIILMTDGIDNNHSAIIKQAEAAKENKIRIFTIGFGKNRSEIEEDFLTQVAIGTGGEYRYADTNNIVGIIGSFMYAQQASEAKVLTDQQGFVAQGETTKAKTFAVPDDMGDLNCILYWPGSILDLIIADPNGRIVDEDYPGAAINNAAIPATVTISDPLPGSWKMKIKCVEASTEYEDGEPYYAIASFKRTNFIDSPATPKLETIALVGAYCLPFGFFAMLLSVMLLIFVNSGRNNRRRRSGNDGSIG